LVRSRLIDVFLSATSGLQKHSRPREHPLLQFEHTRACEKCRFGLKQIGAVDRKQDVADLNIVTYVEISPQNFSGVLREYLDEQIFIEVNRADCGFKKCKITQSDRTIF
jgi:hypothetical protein